MGSDRAPLAETHISVPATAERLADVHAALSHLWARVDAVLPHPPNEEWRVRFDTAVAEIAANIVRHAYPPPATGDMTLTLQVLPDRIEVRFADSGVPFDPARLSSEQSGTDSGAPGSTDLSRVSEGGYGLALVRAVVDDVRYARTPGGRNQWGLVKRLDPTGSTPPVSAGEA